MATPEDILEFLRHAQVRSFQLVEKAVNYEWTFAINHLASEFDTQEEHSIHIDDETEIIEIDGLLGLYTAAKQQITIYEKGISQVAEMLKVREFDLTYVVRLHEWAHALLQIGLPERDRLRVTRDESSWPREDRDVGSKTT